MSNFINPEYKVTDDAQYLPFKKPKTGQKIKSKLAVVGNLDGTNGVSLYDDTELIAKTIYSDNVKKIFNEDSKTLDIQVNADTVKAGDGINVIRSKSCPNEPTLSLDEEFMKAFVIASSPNLRGENGVLVQNDQKIKNGKVISLDDNYIIKQGEY